MKLTSFNTTPIAVLVVMALAGATPALADELNAISVVEDSGSTLKENNNSLTTSALQTTTGLVLSPKETPQSVSVVTQSLLKQRAITSMQDALKTSTGINVITDAGYYRYQSRGFYVDQIEEDGIASTVRGSNANVFRDPQSMTDIAVYDHIELVRGATGLTQANGEPGGTINAVRKRPTSEFQGNLNFLVDSHGKTRGTVDVSGTIGAGVRGRFVSVLERDPTSVDIDKANTKSVIYGVIDKDIGTNSNLTLGVLYQNTHSTPNIYGVPMAVGGTEFGWDRDTYLGFDWNREKARKLNIFAEFSTFFNDDWKLTQKVNFEKRNSYTKFGSTSPCLVVS